MDGTPSISAWFALLAVWGLVVVGYAGVRLGAEPASSQTFLRRLEVEQLLPVVAVVAHAPAIVAIVAGLSWQTPTWWLLAGAPATVVLFIVFGTPLELGRRRSEWWPRIESWERRAVLQAMALLGGALLIVPGAVAVALVLRLELELCVALGLAAGYLLWHGAWARVRHWTAH